MLPPMQVGLTLSHLPGKSHICWITRPGKMYRRWLSFATTAAMSASLRQLGYLEPDLEATTTTVYNPGVDTEPELACTLSASVQQRIAFGERAGQRVCHKLRYQYCQACKAVQRQTVATWFCHQCSDGRGRMLLCEACLMDEHEDHDADEIVY